jgi:alpha-galactosidase
VRIEPHQVHADFDGAATTARLDGHGVVSLGPLDVEVSEHDWSLVNRGDRAVPVRSVAIVHAVTDVAGPLRMLRQGYQSWSPTSVATFGVDHDPSLTPGSIEMVQGIYHADQRRAEPGELRSEWVTVLQDDAGPVLAGFDAGVDHDGTWRLRPGDGDRPELWAEAFLGDAVLAPGEHRRLHAHHLVDGSDDGGVAALLDDWAGRVGRSAGARVAAPYQVGWCSWYHYFHSVTEQHLRHNLARAIDWPFDVFQLDDGYQAAIGDWLTTNSKFPSDLRHIADLVRDTGRQPGIWLAPFIVAPDSRIATEHPDWLARFRNGEPLWGMLNPEWGGGVDGVMYALDTTRDDVIDHLEHVARSLVDAGFTYLKLDFTFAPAFDGVWSDASRTPAQRVRAGYEAIRRGAGDEAFLLGCGAPLSHVVGVVDGNRIGPDVAPSWHRAPDQLSLPGYDEAAPATQHAWADTLSRSFMHRRLWLNDPDCLMLRTSDTAMTAAQVETWARAVAVSGGMALVSDDLALLGSAEQALLTEVVRIGRTVDAAAVTGPAPVCDDLMVQTIPHRLSAAGYTLDADPLAGTSELRRPA